MLAARADLEWVSLPDRAESEAGPPPLPTTRQCILVGGEAGPTVGSGGTNPRLTEGERAGTDFAYEPRHLATTSSER
jgi:hypothetical protein